MSLVHGAPKTHSRMKISMSQDLSGSCLTNLRNEVHGPWRMRFRKKCFIIRNVKGGRVGQNASTEEELEEIWSHQAV